MKLQLLSTLCAAALALGLSACDSSSSDTALMKHSAPAAPVTTAHDGPALDTHLYLEEVLGEQALSKVEQWNARTLERLTAYPLFEQMQSEALEILNSKEKIAYVSYRAGRVHNFWQDANHVRGIWRSADLQSYLDGAPKWETVLDYDALSKTEGKNWVYKGNSCLAPDYTRCMISLSDGGKDAVVRREFDTTAGQFVDGGFIAPESRGTTSWLDKDRIVIAVDFGKDANGQSTTTDSGYARVGKLWTRGTPLSEAVTIGETTPADIGYWPWVLEMPDGRKELMVSISKTFFESEDFWVPMKDGQPQPHVKLPIPAQSDIGEIFKGQMIMRINESWRGHASGTLVSFSIADFMEDGEIETVNVIYKPHARSSINNYSATQSKLMMSISENVSSSAYAYDWDGKKWSGEKLDFPEGTVSIRNANDKDDIAFISTENFLAPDTLWTYNTATKETHKVKSLPQWFDAQSMVAEQFMATSTDGEQIPYFVVRKQHLVMDGSHPTLLYGYGGFKISINPSYSATRGKLWVERGGVYVLANIRGGGEFGPDWHQAGLKTERQKIYDDFIAVAEALIDSGLTSSEHLGIEGGSNGGLLMGVMFTQRPDLFNAVVCAVPLLDMMRYHTLLAGASWVGEYGNPEDPVEGEFLKSISPYHNMRGATDYPEIFFVTSTKDDRVHPGHARKMAARMEDLGKAFLYYENIDGGHSASANLEETAKRLALQHTYLMQKLK